MEGVIFLNEMQEPDKIIEIDLPTVAKHSLVITATSLVILFVFNGLIEKGMFFNFSLLKVILFIIGYVLLIVLHELFHLLGFRVFAGVPWKKMIVGVNLKMGIAYATTDEMMTNGALRKALLLPFWTTGVVPAIIGLYMDDGVIMGLAALLIGGAAGDFAMYRALKKLPDDWLVKDDPEKPTLYLFDSSK